MSQRYYKKNQPTVLETIIVGVFKGLWWLIKLPFSGLKKKRVIASTDRAYILKNKQEIREMVKRGSQAELEHAVVAADKLVDYKFELLGYRGNSFAEKLRYGEKYIDSNTYNRLWRCHKIRNRIVHENRLEITENELQGAVDGLLDYLDK